MTVGELDVIVGANIQGFKSAMSSVMGTLGKIGIAFAGIDTIMSGIDYNKNAEKAEVAFGTILGSAEEARKMMQGLKADAASTPFELPELQDAAKKLAAYGVETGKIRTSLTMLGDVASGLGIPLGELSDIFGKIKVQGKAMTEDINQFAGRGIPIWDELAKVTGKSGDELRKLVETGKIGFPEINKAFENMTGEGGKFTGMMEAQSKTLDGMLSTLKDTFTGAIAKGLEALMPIIKGVVGAATQFFDLFSKLPSEFTLITAGAIAMAIAIGKVKAAMTDGGSQKFADGFKDLGKKLKGSAVEIGIALAGMGVGVLVSQFEDVEKKSKETLAKIADEVQKYNDQLNATQSDLSSYNAENKLTQEQILKLAKDYPELTGKINLYNASIRDTSLALEQVRLDKAADSAKQASQAFADAMSSMGSARTTMTAWAGAKGNFGIGKAYTDNVKAYAQKLNDVEQATLKWNRAQNALAQGQGSAKYVNELAKEVDRTTLAFTGFAASIGVNGKDVESYFQQMRIQAKSSADAQTNAYASAGYVIDVQNNKLVRLAQTEKAQSDAKAKAASEQKQRDQEDAARKEQTIKKAKETYQQEVKIADLMKAEGESSQKVLEKKASAAQSYLDQLYEFGPAYADERKELKTNLSSWKSQLEALDQKNDLLNQSSDLQKEQKKVVDEYFTAIKLANAYEVDDTPLENLERRKKALEALLEYNIKNNLNLVQSIAVQKSGLKMLDEEIAKAKALEEAKEQEAKLLAELGESWDNYGDGLKTAKDLKEDAFGGGETSQAFMEAAAEEKRLLEELGDSWDNNGEGIKAVTPQLQDFIEVMKVGSGITSQFGSSVIDGLMGIADTVGNIVAAAEGDVSKIGPAIEAGFKVFLDLIPGFEDELKKAGDALDEWWAHLWGQKTEAEKQAEADALKAANELAAATAKAAAEAYKVARGWTSAETALSSTITALQDKIANLSNIPDWLGGIKAAFMGDLESQLTEAVKKLDLMKAQAALAEKAKSMASTFSNALKTGLKEGMDSATFATSVKEMLYDMAIDAALASATIAPQIAKIGQMVADALQDGVLTSQEASKITGFANSVYSQISATIGNVRSMLGISTATDTASTTTSTTTSDTGDESSSSGIVQNIYVTTTPNATAGQIASATLSASQSLAFQGAF